MKNKNNHYFLIAIIGVGLFLTQISLVQGQTVISSEIRPRAEYRHGYGGLADSGMYNAFFIDQRTRINLEYKSEGYAVRISLQDIRTWGSQEQGNKSDGLSSIHEAWGEAFISKTLSLKFGRQEIIYDDHRIFGNVGWSQQARSHDAAIMKYNGKKISFHVGFAYNQDKPQTNTTIYTVKKSYKALQYLWLHKEFNKKLTANALFLNNGLQASTVDSASGFTKYKDNYSQTMGTRISYKRDKSGMNINVYYQTGIDGDWADTYISALLIGGDIFYKVSEKVTLTLGYEQQTGNSQTASGSWTESKHSFSPFYGTNHKFNGHMDYFYVGNHLGSVGLQDGFLKFKYVNGDKYIFGADVHYFLAASNVLDSKELLSSGNTVAMDNTLGTEIDLSFGFQLAKDVTCKFGYSHMIATETMEALMLQRGAVLPDKDEMSNWGWVMLIVKPVLYKSAKK